jgi:hypothetical protein
MILIAILWHRGLPIICTNSTYVLPAVVSVVAVNGDPLRSPATHSTRFLSCSIFFPRTRTISVLSHLGWLGLIIIYSRVSYCYHYLNLIGYVTFNTAYYLEHADVVLTVQWITNSHVLILSNMYRTVVSTCSLKNTGMISSVRHVCVKIDIELDIDFTSVRIKND